MKKNTFSISRFFVFFFIFVFSVTASCKKKEKVDPDNNGASVDTTMVYYTADNSLIQYTGRIDFSNPLRPEFAYSGVSIKAKFQGPAIDIVMKDFGSGGNGGTNYYHILIDGTLHKVLQVNSSDTLYTAARGLTDTEHTIEVFKRTESNVGKSQFRGIRIRINKNLLALPSQPSRKIEFIGDSFTCGYGNEVSIPYPGGNPTTGFNSVNENNYSSWGAIVCRNFNAQYNCTAISGRGLYRNNTGSTTETMPLVYTRTLPNSTIPAWNTSDYIPDLIVIHIGTNDFAPEAWSSPSMVDSTQFVSTYINFVSALRGYYPSAHIICVVPNSVSDGWPVGLNTLTRIKSYIDATVDHHVDMGDNNVHYFELTTQTSPYGEDWHPSNATHQSMANQINTFIETIMGW